MPISEVERLWGKWREKKNVFFLQFNVTYLFNRVYTAQSNPLAHSQATPYRGECAMENRGKRKGDFYEISGTPVLI